MKPAERRLQLAPPPWGMRSREDPRYANQPRGGWGISHAPLKCVYPRQQSQKFTLPDARTLAWSAEICQAIVHLRASPQWLAAEAISHTITLLTPCYKRRLVSISQVKNIHDSYQIWSLSSPSFNVVNVLSPAPLEGSGSVGARKKAPDYFAGGLLATWLEPRNCHTGQESDGDYTVAKHEEYKAGRIGGQTRPSHCRRSWHSLHAVSGNMTDRARRDGINSGLRSLSLQN